MDKLRVILRAKAYMDMLANGIDPISGEAVQSDSALQQERLQKCFAFVSDILDEIVQTNGIVALPPTEDSVGYVATKRKATFSITPQQRGKMWVSASPIIPSAFVKNVNAVIDTENMEKLSIKSINTWLIKQGYLAESKVKAVINRSVKTTTPISDQIGIIEQTVVDNKTGEAKTQLLFTQQAQEFLLDNIDKIVSAES